MTLCSACNPHERVSSVIAFDCGHTFKICCLIKTQPFPIFRIGFVCSLCNDPNTILSMLEFPNVVTQ